MPAKPGEYDDENHRRQQADVDVPSRQNAHGMLVVWISVAGLLLACTQMPAYPLIATE